MVESIDQLNRLLHVHKEILIEDIPFDNHVLQYLQLHTYFVKNNIYSCGYYYKEKKRERENIFIESNNKTL